MSAPRAALNPTLNHALNHAHEMGHATSDLAWRMALRPASNAVGRGDVDLDIQQRRVLIEHAAADVSAFFFGLALVPLRPTALAVLTVGGFVDCLGVLLVGQARSEGIGISSRRPTGRLAPQRRRGAGSRFHDIRPVDLDTYLGLPLLNE
jgi:hypothetical protein